MTTDKEDLERQLRFREREMRKGLFELYDRLNKPNKIISEVCKMDSLLVYDL